MSEPHHEQYTPGMSSGAVAFMSQRRAETHAGFFLPHLASGQAVLDVGCGPGDITLGLARVVAPGPVLGIDQGAEQLEHARAGAAAAGLQTVAFHPGSCYELPAADSSQDRVFSHALLEHLSRPRLALSEARRVLRPGGVIGVCSPDWGGFILSPTSRALDAALHRYQDLQRSNGGDPHAGRHLAEHLDNAGFHDIRSDARYERYLDARSIAAYLAEQLHHAEAPEDARVLEAWAEHPAAMFAQTWVSATGRRPT